MCTLIVIESTRGAAFELRCSWQRFPRLYSSTHSFPPACPSQTSQGILSFGYRRKKRRKKWCLKYIKLERCQDNFTVKRRRWLWYRQPWWWCEYACCICMLCMLNDEKDAVSRCSHRAAVNGREVLVKFFYALFCCR